MERKVERKNMYGINKHKSEQINETRLANRL